MNTEARKTWELTQVNPFVVRAENRLSEVKGMTQIHPDGLLPNQGCGEELLVLNFLFCLDLERGSDA